MERVIRTSVAVAVVVVLSSAGFVRAQPKSDDAPTRESLQRLYSDFLSSEGYRPEVDSDGDIRFKREGKGYFIHVGEDDPGFFQVVLPNIWAIESVAERAKVLAAVDYSNSKSKVSKAFTVNDNVWVAVELFVASPEDFKKVFSRSLSAVDNGATNFVSKMRE